MKLIIRLINIAIIFLLIGGAFFLLINKTFIYEAYKGELMDGRGIPIKRFMYVVDDKENPEAKFYTFLSNTVLEDEKKKYLEKLQACYGKYYYDKDNNITIISYDISSKDYYREVYISYASDNYCSEEYVLSDMWVYEYNGLSSFLGGDISEKTMTSLIDKIYNSKRVDPVIKDYKNEYSYRVECDNNGENYSLIFEDFSENELMVKKIEKENIKFAVYEILNVKDYLKGLV